MPRGTRSLWREVPDEDQTAALGGCGSRASTLLLRRFLRPVPEPNKPTLDPIVALCSHEKRYNEIEPPGLKTSERSPPEALHKE